MGGFGEGFDEAAVCRADYEAGRGVLAVCEGRAGGTYILAAIVGGGG